MGIAVAQMSRSELKELLRESDEAQVSLNEMQSEILAADAAIDQAVESHRETTTALRASIASASNPKDRTRLFCELDAANKLLDETCNSMRSRITKLQQDSYTLAWTRPQRNLVEQQLISSASQELQDEYWHVGLDHQHADARRIAAKKSLQNAEIQLKHAQQQRDEAAAASLAGTVRRWTAEHEHLSGLVEKLAADKEEIRQRMLWE